MFIKQFNLSVHNVMRYRGLYTVESNKKIHVGHDLRTVDCLEHSSLSGGTMWDREQLSVFTLEF